MKENELMIGDWVMLDNNPVKVAILAAGRGDLGLAAGEDVFARTYNMIEPIPLTEEILKDNGWKPLKNKAWLGITVGCDEVNIMLGKNYTEIGYLNLCFNHEDPTEVNFGANLEFPKNICVHELQHLLRMYDIDKDIVIKKK